VQDPPRRSRRAEPSALAPLQNVAPYSGNVSLYSGAAGASNMPTFSNSAAPVTASASAPLKLYGRVEELRSEPGAHIPLKMRAMTPIRDTSLDAVVSQTKLAGKAALNSNWLVPNLGSIVSKNSLLTDSVIKSQAPSPPPPPAFPTDWVGTWSGEMTVNMTDCDPRNFDFDRAEAEKQQKMLKTGIKGNCSVTFFRADNNKIAVKPTQVFFTTTESLAEATKTLANSQYAGMLGGAANADAMASNPMFASMQINVPFGLPLGLNTLSDTGVTGNQINNELMKNSLKDLAKGVLEQTVVTRDNEKTNSGKSRVTFSESDLQFTRLDDQRLSLQAAAVSYDEQGQYLNKVILSGVLVKGAPVVNPMANMNPFAALGGMGGMGGLGGLGGLGGMGGGTPGGSGSGGNPLGGLFGGGNGGGNGGSGGSLGDQMKQVQDLLKEMGGQ